MTDQSPHDKAADAVHEGRPVEAQYVRGGRGGNRILMVLIGGIALVAICFALIYAFSAGPLAETNPNAGNQPVDVRAFDGDAATPPAADAPTTATGEPANPPTGGASNVNAPTVSAPPSQ
ncbi:MAG: hypothetical protein KKC29_12190 [Alphaproteobacteria bacterium]|jgi:hypothetical protein|nr:hypothetical protein [Alphaproteobacteria bacterium]MBU2040492.1 hypothetical protein [Alphaproteobacteria bacterium]MBU2124541.1 hypothetical protein [Alphaproteobacteria bacterium]MBU2208129.1 hypothetical protein [Alphaproteobacteria bacterium]MBU2291847.1 hypothetical protein [Alphaproteobacteria bacterium]